MNSKAECRCKSCPTTSLCIAKSVRRGINISTEPSFRPPLFSRFNHKKCLNAKNFVVSEMDAAVYLDKCKLQEKTKHPQMLNLLKNSVLCGKNRGS